MDPFPHAGRGSSVGCASASLRTVTGSILTFVEIGHEIISTAILSLPLIQEEQMSVTGERKNVH